MKARKTNIIVATDFSPESEAGIRFSRKLVDKLKTDELELVLLSVLDGLEEKDVRLKLSRAILESHGVHENSYANAVSELNHLRETFLKDLPVETLVIRAKKPVHTEIVEYAKTLNADLLIMSFHKRSTVSHLILGSVLEKVLHEAPCPVVVVPTESCTR